MTGLKNGMDRAAEEDTVKVGYVELAASTIYALDTRRRLLHTNSGRWFVRKQKASWFRGPCSDREPFSTLREHEL